MRQILKAVILIGLFLVLLNYYERPVVYAAKIPYTSPSAYSTPIYGTPTNELYTTPAYGTPVFGYATPSGSCTTVCTQAYAYCKDGSKVPNGRNCMDTCTGKPTSGTVTLNNACGPISKAYTTPVYDTPANSYTTPAYVTPQYYNTSPSLAISVNPLVANVYPSNSVTYIVTVTGNRYSNLAQLTISCPTGAGVTCNLAQDDAASYTAPNVFRFDHLNDDPSDETGHYTTSYTVSTTNGTSPSSQDISFVVDAYSTSVCPGPGCSDNTSATFNVLGQAAAISVDPTTFNFYAPTGSAPAGQTLTVGDTGSHPLAWSAVTNQSWCHITPSSGTINPGATTDTSLTMDAQSSSGTSTCVVTVAGSDTSNGSAAANSPQSAVADYYVSSGPTGKVQGFKVIEPGDIPVEPASSQTITIDGGSPTTANPYSFQGVSAGNHTFAVTVPAGWTAKYTACINNTTCHGGVPSAGNSAVLNVPSGGYVDLWWQFYPPVIPKAHITVSPGFFNFVSPVNVAPTSQSLTIGNTGGANLSWYAMTNQSWCHANPANGDVAVGGNTSINVSVDALSSQGTNYCTISIIDPAADNSPKQVSVIYAVTNAVYATPGNSQASLKLTPTSFNFNAVYPGAAPTSQTLKVSNIGDADMPWTIDVTSDTPWCHATALPGNNYINFGTDNYATVNVDAPSNIGTFTCTFEVVGYDPDGSTLADNSPKNVTVTYTVSASSSNPPSGASASNASCGKVSLTWTDNSVNETGFTVYKDGVSVAVVNSTTGGSTGTSYSYDYNTGTDTTNHAYSIASTNSSGSSSQVTASPSSIASFACSANMFVSDKDIISVNGVPVSGISPCNAKTDTSGLPNLKVQDKVTFSINLCNSGVSTATPITITDTLINFAAPVGGWKIFYDGNLLNSGTDYTITGTSPNQNLTVHLNAPSQAVGPKNGGLTTVRALTFDAVIQSSASSVFGRAKNSANICYHDGSGAIPCVFATTPLLLFSNINNVPVKSEVAP